MKSFRPVIVFAVLGAATLVGISIFGVVDTFALAAKSNAGHQSGHTQTAENTPANAAATLTPAPTNSSTPAASTATKTPGVRQPDIKTGRCEGINGGNDECVTKNMAQFSIASVTLWPQSVVCTGDDVTVNFYPLNATRYYLAGGGGNALVQVDYSDGSSSPIITLPFTAGGANIQYYNGLSHTFHGVSNHSYRVRLTSPNTLDLGWTSIKSGLPSACGLPSPSPSPGYW